MPPVSDENIAESARFLFLPMSEYAEILLYHAVKQFVSVYLADETAGILVVGYIGRVFREDIADYLIYRVISFFAESIVYGLQNIAVFQLPFNLGSKGYGFIVVSVHIAVCSFSQNYSDACGIKTILLIFYIKNPYFSITLQKINKILHNFFRRTLWKQD